MAPAAASHIPGFFWGPTCHILKLSTLQLHMLPTYVLLAVAPSTAFLQLWPWSSPKPSSNGVTLTCRHQAWPVQHLTSGVSVVQDSIWSCLFIYHQLQVCIQMLKLVLIIMVVCSLMIKLEQQANKNWPASTTNWLAGTEA